MTKRVAQFVLLESFAEALGGRRFKNFDEALFLDAAKRNLPTMVKTAGDDAPIVQDRYMRVKGAA